MKDHKTLYKIANPIQRITARLVDYLFLLIVTFIVNVILINITELNTMFNDFANFKMPYWKIWFVILSTDLITFLYFILIPYWTNGYTLFIFAFKMKIMDHQNKRLTFKQICLRESIMTLAPIFFSLFKPIFLTGDNTPMQIVSMVDNSNGSVFWVDLFQAIESVLGLAMMALAMSMFFIKNNKGFHDIVSLTYVVNKKPMSEPQKVYKKTDRKSLPGELSKEALESIKEINEK